MADPSAGRASVPDRVGAFVAEREGMLAAMPGYTPSAGALAAKLVTLFRGTRAPPCRHTRTGDLLLALPLRTSSGSDRYAARARQPSRT
jgi:hypothetical protein